MGAKEIFKGLLRGLAGKVQNGVIYDDGKNKLAFEHIDDYGDNQSYYVFFASAGTYAGDGSLNILKNDAKRYIKTADSMLKTLSGKLRIQSCEDESFLEFEFQNSLNNHLIVRGLFEAGYGTWDMIRFEFEADQTVLSELKKALCY